MIRPGDAADHALSPLLFPGADPGLAGGGGADPACGGGVSRGLRGGGNRGDAGVRLGAFAPSFGKLGPIVTAVVCCHLTVTLMKVLRFHEPTIVTIVQWYAAHRYRTGRDEHQAVPYLVMAFLCQSDLWTSALLPAPRRSSPRAPGSRGSDGAGLLPGE